MMPILCKTCTEVCEEATKLEDRARDFYSFFYHLDMDGDLLARIMGPGSHPGNPYKP